MAQHTRARGVGIAWHDSASVRGFTLLELLIAMTLLVLVITLATGALRLASRSVAAGERRIESQERLRSVWSLLDAQIQSGLPLTYEEEGSTLPYFRGERHSLRLVTSQSLWSGAGGYTLVNYRVENDERGRQMLLIGEQTPGIEGKREIGLLSGADEIFFEYYRREPADAVGTWIEQWNEEVLLPEAVRLQVGYGGKKFIFRFPVRGQSKKSAVPLTAVPAREAAGR